MVVMCVMLLVGAHVQKMYPDISNLGCRYAVINISIRALSSVSHSFCQQKKKLIQFFLLNFLKCFDKTLPSLIKVKSRTILDSSRRIF